MPEYVYALTNPAMPGIVKVGKTQDVQQRVRNLSSHSGVPVPFEIELAVKVEDAKRLEDALFSVLRGSRVNQKREFFEVDVEDLRSVLVECGEDVTTSLDPRQGGDPLEDQSDGDEDRPPPLDDDDFAAGARLRRRRPPLNFEDLHIQIGAQLVSTREGANGQPQSAEVIAPKHVRFQDKRMSLTQATRLVLGRDYDVSPLPYWRTEDGWLLQSIYDDHHGPPQ